MGLADRHYMREPEYHGPYNAPWSVTARLMLVIVAAFVLQQVAGFYFQSLQLDRLLALSLEGLSKGHIWQFITFQFLHAGFLHLLFNLITIYFFGKPMEEALGGKRMLQLYLSAGVFGGVLQMLAALLVPSHFGGAVVGASAGAFGLVAAFATLFPDRVLTLLIFFIIPVSMRAKTLLWISLGLGIFGVVVPGDGIAHAAHLGGIAVGYAFIHWRISPSLPTSWRFRPRRRPARPLARVTRGRGGFQAPPPIIDAEELPPTEFISREVDPILDKISQHGIHSLTERERKILEKARERMGKS